MISLLRASIENWKIQLISTCTGTAEHEFAQNSLENAESQLRMYISIHIQNYREMLTKGHLNVLRTLNEMIASNRDDFLVRRAYVIAYFGCICSALFERTEFTDMKRYFPAVKLPIIVTLEDNVAFSDINYRYYNLQPHIWTELLGFVADPRTRSEENLRCMFWAPILKAMFNSLKLSLAIDDLSIIAEYNTQYIPEFPELRFVDMAVVSDGPDGLPILLVEMSAHPVPAGLFHKDFRKMAICMIFILTEKVKRAELHCPDEDFTKFRVHGLLIAGYDFEFCVGTVMKDSCGRINFMFHTNSRNWKFSMADPRGPTAGEFVHPGNEIIVESFEEYIGGDVGDPFDLQVANGSIESEEGEDESDAPIPDVDFASAIVQTPHIILWKFIRAMMVQYNDLPQCLKECIKTKPTETSSIPSRYNHLPKDLRPGIASSRSDHGRLSAQLIPDAVNLEKLIETETMAQMYSTLIHTRIPNLPKVIVFDETKRQCTVQEHDYGIYEYCVDFVKIPDRKRPVKSCLSAKFILDMLIAAYQLHKRGLVCGGFISHFTRYDGMYWYLKSLGRVRTVKEAEEFGIPRFTDPSEASFHLQPPQIISQRDDLYGIIRTFMRNFHGTFVDAIFESSTYPLFDRFKVETYSKMNNFNEYPNVTVEDILSKAIPAYNDLIDGTVLTGEFVLYQRSLEATKILAHEVLREISGRRGSISMHSIHSTTSESSDEKT